MNDRCLLLICAHNRTINGDDFGFALNVCLTPCTRGPKFEKCCVSYLKILYRHMVQDKVMKLTRPLSSMAIIYFFSKKVIGKK